MIKKLVISFLTLSYLINPLKLVQGNEGEIMDLVGNERSIVEEIDQLMAEENFTNETGYQAWLDFKDFTQQVAYVDLNNLDDLSQGSSLADVDDFFLNRQVIREENDLGDGELQVYYRYMDPEGKKYDDEFPIFYGEILAHFIDEQLVFASVQPGYYDVSRDLAIEAEEIYQAYELVDLMNLDQEPYLMSVTQVNFQESLVTGLGVFSLYTDEENQDYLFMIYPLLAYNSTEDIYSIFSIDLVNFQEAGQDFGNMAFIVMRENLFNLED